MRAILAGALGLGLIAGSPALADHHNNGGGGSSHESHASHSSEHASSHSSSSSHSFIVHHATEHRSSEHVSIHGHVSSRHVAVVHHSHSVGVRVSHRATVVHGHFRPAHFHMAFRAPHRFHIRPWIAPRGFYYRRFAIGERVPAVLLISTYFLTDFALYGLEEPDDGYVWVRDGDDAVLVDEETGEVIEVEYDVFY